MENKKENKKIPTKNYVIFSIMVVFTITLTFFLSHWYNLNKDLNKKNTIMSEFLVKMNEKEFENYILENNNTIIYLASSKNENINEFEQAFKNLIIENGFENQIIFLDLETIDKDFFQELKNNYFADNLKNISIGNFTNVLVMEEGKITSILYNKESDININDVQEFFYNRGVIGQA